jgi:CheY-like chemotaxis protein
MAPPVLIVDDEESLRSFSRRALEREGYTVVEASNAEEALQILQTQVISVILCDVGMPGAGGAWLASQVSEQFRTTAFIFATGEDALPANRFLIPGVVGYLVKPIGTTALLETVQMAMLWHRAAAGTGRK